MPGPTVTLSSVVVRLARDIRTALDQQFGVFGLTSQQAAVLIHVHLGQSTPRRIADLVGTDTAGMTRLLDRLEAKGLLRRHPDGGDRRAVVVALTDDGSALIPHLPPVFERVGAVAAAGIAAQDLDTTTRVLRTMLDQVAGVGPAERAGRQR